MTQKLLNIRKIYIPDPGYTIVDADLAGADAMVFAWEVGEGAFKQQMRAGIKLHVESNRFMFPDKCGPDGKREPYYTKVKSAGHGTNYGGGAPTIATNLAWPEDWARKFQRYWFDRFPEIKAYHHKVERNLMLTNQVHNKFGYRIHFFDDVARLLPEALAWLPQSTVAIVCFRAALLLRREFPEAQMLVQVHDSNVFQIPTRRVPYLLPQIAERFAQTSIVPYDDPLPMKWSFKMSDVSWGDCHPVDWDNLRRAA